jgi:hypothetical protein
MEYTENLRIRGETEAWFFIKRLGTRLVEAPCYSNLTESLRDSTEHREVMLLLDIKNYLTWMKVILICGIISSSRSHAFPSFVQLRDVSINTYKNSEIFVDIFITNFLLNTIFRKFLIPCP